jgi:hypothetical protein
MIIFIPMTAEVTEGWRKFNIQEFNHIYSSPNIGRLIISGMRTFP